MKLQYQLSNGNWSNCNEDYDGNQRDRTDEFLTYCEQNNRISSEGRINDRATYATDRQMTRDEVIEALTVGKTLRNDRDDWYSNCRDGEYAEKRSAERRAAQATARDYPNGRKLDCGHTVYYKINVMSASIGSSCSECYDRMSN